jgi:hypothetical protein
MRNSILLGLLMALFFVQCTKDDEIRMDTQTTVLEDKEQVTFLIQIVDEADTAIPGAALINLMTGQSWSADERGLVLLSNLDVRKLPSNCTMITPTTFPIISKSKAARLPGSTAAVDL